MHEYSLTVSTMSHFRMYPAASENITPADFHENKINEYSRRKMNLLNRQVPMTRRLIRQKTTMQK